MWKNLNFHGSQEMNSNLPLLGNWGQQKAGKISGIKKESAR